MTSPIEVTITVHGDQVVKWGEALDGACEVYASVGPAVRMLRVSIGTPRAHLARSLGMPQGRLARYESQALPATPQDARLMVDWILAHSASHTA